LVIMNVETDLEYLVFRGISRRMSAGKHSPTVENLDSKQRGVK
jgi:hypothetical protein